MEIHWLWLTLIKGIGPITARKLLQYYKDAYCIYNATKDELENINILNKKQLQELTTSKSPIVLFYRGNILKENLSVGIIGARRCTDYGKKVAADTAEYLAQNGVTVISGMAKAIDSYSHTSCLKSGGYTLAFLGSGVDICYPSEHSVLMKRIIENGAVISEFLPSTKPIQSNL